MKLLEVWSPPRLKAGLAEIQFVTPSELKEPVRDGAEIRIPAFSDAELFWIHQNEQFLLRQQIGKDYNRPESGWWFGGTDEQPFLVRINQAPFEVFQKNGETAFYQALKPDVVHFCERAFKVEAKRQGDIFAAALPWSWDELGNIAYVLVWTNLEITPTERKQERRQVFGTRHTLQGIYRSGSNHVVHSFGEGVLTAPDHSPLTLEGVHLIAQTKNLFAPQSAD